MSYKFDLGADIFGEDLEKEGVNPLLMMKVVKQGEQQGWAYHLFNCS